MGTMHTLILVESTVKGRANRVFSCGNSVYGQVGTGIIGKVSIPTEITQRFNGMKVVQVSAGDDHSLFLTKSNQVFGCGSNMFS